MTEVDYGKGRDLSAIWEFRKTWISWQKKRGFMIRWTKEMADKSKITIYFGIIEFFGIY
jgi:hypothetical protein